jgi:branched-chain amino acid transport system substrate-binding protein
MAHKLFRQVMLSLALLAGLAGTSAAAHSEILVGATVSLEGRFEAPSRMVRLAYRLWEKQINTSGGLLGRPVRLILYDDKSRRQLVSLYYEKLISDDKVDLVLAPYGTELTFAASEVAERHGFVLMASSASGEKIWNQGYHYVFGIPDVAGRHFIGFMDLAARYGLQTVAIVYEDTQFTHDAAEGAAQWARRLGMHVVLDRVYRDSARDIPKIVAQLARLHPDGVVFCTYPTDGYQLLKLLGSSRYRPQAVALSITPALPDFFEKAGPLAEGVFGPSQWEPNERLPFPGTSHFVEAFNQFAGVAPSYHAGCAYAACQLLEQSITLLGEIDHNKIRDYIASLDTVTVIGRFKVDGRGRQIGHNTIIIQWQEGKKQIVYPSKMQTTKPLFGIWGRAAHP